MCLWARIEWLLGLVKVLVDAPKRALGLLIKCISYDLNLACILPMVNWLMDAALQLMHWIAYRPVLFEHTLCHRFQCKDTLYHQQKVFPGASSTPGTG